MAPVIPNSEPRTDGIVIQAPNLTNPTRFAEIARVSKTSQINVYQLSLAKAN